MPLFDTFDPLAMLGARAQAQQSPTQSAAPAAGGASPSVAPQAGAAAPPATGSAPEGGGLSFSGLGGRLAQAFAGERGLFQAAPDAAADQAIDPLTGLPAGLSRRANNQSIMKMGLLLMAAGARQSDDSRARILSAIPGALDTSSTLSGFAQNRLEMAKLRLTENQMLAEQAAGTAASQAFGLPTTTGGTTVAGVGGLPSSVTPAGVAPSPALVTPAGPAVADGTRGLGVEPSVTAAPLAPLGDPSQAPAAQPMVIASNALPTTAPQPPKIGAYQPTEDDRKIAAMTPMKDRAALFADRAKAWNSQEVKTDPYLNPNVGIMQDVYENGRKIRSEKIGEPTSSVAAERQPDGSMVYRTITADGRVTDQRTERDPVRDNAAIGDAADIRKQAMEFNTTFKDARKASVDYDKIKSLRDEVVAGMAITGVGADARRQGLNFLASLGWLKPEKIDTLVTTADVRARLGQAGGEFAKENYGPNISNADVANANEVVGALMTNDKNVIAASLERVMASKRQAVESYNDDANYFNGLVPDEMAKRYRARVIDRAFNDEPASGNASQPAPAGEAPAAPAGENGAYTEKQKSEAVAVDVSQANQLISNGSDYGEVVNALLGIYSRDELAAAGFKFKE